METFEIGTSSFTYTKPTIPATMTDEKNVGDSPEHDTVPIRQSAPVRRGPLPLDIPILSYLNSKRVILASASPRRKTLLQQVSFGHSTFNHMVRPESVVLTQSRGRLGSKTSRSCLRPSPRTWIRKHTAPTSTSRRRLAKSALMSTLRSPRRTLSPSRILTL